ncbi:carbohydrate kinase family protein [Rubrobacter aplysinae]|uniref:carbohydrate kinase family protein n=1 Tax=Rubrobacter aplysinae TaxID=909625 RepID=UPI00064C3085|nr:carbohydrate kinase family protein [Rubrobacter aplysinae]
MRPLLLAAGYVNVDVTAELGRIPGFGERVTAGRISRSPGGMTANMACAASRLGMEVRFFGGVGPDTGGEEAVAELARFGVDTSAMTASEGSTTTSLILLGPEGDRAIVSEPLAFDYQPLRAALVESPERRKCLHVDGYRLADGLSVLRQARRAGFVTSADLDGIEPGELAAKLPEIAEALDVAFLNAGLAEALAEDPEEAADQITGQGVTAAAVTLGGAGAVVADGSGCWRVSTPEVEVVDATGAGDVFAAAFLAEWVEGGDTERAGRFAAAAAAISVGAAGARGQVPYRGEVVGLIEAS